MTAHRELSFDERMSIQILHSQGSGVREIDRRLARSPSTISRELRRSVGGLGYAADAAQADAKALRCKPRVPRKLSDVARWAYVQSQLRLRWSPQQIAVRLRHELAGAGVDSLSHETIYQAIYLVPRGELRRELIGCLRQGHGARLRRSRGKDRRSQIPDMQSIHIRPPEVATSLVPGHWEGDLIKGAGNRSAVGVLVERQIGFTLLAQMPSGSAADALAGFDRALQGVPPHLRKSLTYDQGREMSYHLALSIRTGVEIYFADPHAPWQRGTCENTNGLLREYLPEGTDLSVHSQAALDAIALSLNTRPRVRHRGRTPLECYTDLLALDQMRPRPVQ